MHTNKSSEITVEFKLHSDFSKFQLVATPQKGQKLSPQDLINCLNAAIEHVEQTFDLKTQTQGLSN